MEGCLHCRKSRAQFSVGALEELGTWSNQVGCVLTRSLLSLRFICRLLTLPPDQSVPFLGFKTMGVSVDTWCGCHSRHGRVSWEQDSVQLLPMIHRRLETPDLRFSCLLLAWFCHADLLGRSLERGDLVDSLRLPPR